MLVLNFSFTLFLVLFFMLLAIIFIYLKVGTTDMETVSRYIFNPLLQKWLWVAFFAAFAVKIPMWPLHTWLPDAHVEAPTAGSIILAGVLLKIGAYGFLRFSIPLFPAASLYFTPFILSLSIIAIIYASLVALVQKDMKKLIAYSSIAHMGFVTMGIFVMTLQSLTGAIIQMLSHGIVSAALFLCVGMVYDRLHTREIACYGGLVKIMPIFATMFMIFTAALIGLPGTSGFLGELLVIVGVYKVFPVVAALACIGMVLGASYGLWLYQRVIFGTLTNLKLKVLLDLNVREITILSSLAFVVFWIGLYPAFFTSMITPAVQKMTENYYHASEGKNK